MIRELAENANTHTPLGPDEERIVTDRYVVWLGRGAAPAWNVVQRLRLGEGSVEDAVDEVHDLLRARGRTACTWEVADSATPPDLVERLLALGLRPDAEPYAVGMVLRRPPLGGRPEGVEVRAAATRAEVVAGVRIAGEAFGMAPGDVEETAARAAADPVDPTSVTYLAYLAGEPAARATAISTEHGVLLFGGATLAGARGRGLYRALVWARWEDAVARGTPVLVTHAGAMSRPILERLGFEQVCGIHVLLDDFATPAA